MSFKTGLTQKDIQLIQCECKSISKLESKVSESELRRQLYVIGVHVYRQFNKVGLPVDFKHPGLTQPRLKWCSKAKDFVDERIYDEVEQYFKTKKVVTT